MSQKDDNQITIENSYGKLTLKEPDGHIIITTKGVKELLDIMETRVSNYCMSDVKVTTYVGNEDNISDAMDLTMLAALCCWGKGMYAGDCIKLTISAEYLPENK